MKKIMFNDKYGLTRAVLEGSKTMIRRVIDAKTERWERFKHGDDTSNWESPYQIIEKIAVAQSYQTLEREIERLGLPLNLKPDVYKHAGYKNKMFVKPEDMPHYIKMLNYHVERLQDISDEDCLKEGVVKAWIGYYVPELKANWEKESHIDAENGQTWKLFPTPQEAFAALIDKVSGKGTWASNPLVWVYEFKLID